MNLHSVLQPLRCAPPTGLACLLVRTFLLAACDSSNEDAAFYARDTAPLNTVARCQEGWSYYEDPGSRFSFCYLGEFALKVSPREPYAVSVELPVDGGVLTEANVIAFFIFWAPASRFESG